MFERGSVGRLSVLGVIGRAWDPAVFDPMVATWLAGDLSPGVPGGETGEQIVTRVLHVLDDLADPFRGETMLVVSHGGVMVTLWAHAAREWDGAHIPPNCGIVLIEHGVLGYASPRVIDYPAACSAPSSAPFNQ